MIGIEIIQNFQENSKFSKNYFFRVELRSVIALNKKIKVLKKINFQKLDIFKNLQKLLSTIRKVPAIAFPITIFSTSTIAFQINSKLRYCILISFCIHLNTSAVGVMGINDDIRNFISDSDIYGHPNLTGVSACLCPEL